jgi:nitroreductase
MMQNSLTQPGISTMDFFEAVKQRRSVKHYDPTAKMTAEELDCLMAAVLFSPTSFNIQNWRFVLVEEAALRQQIQDAAWGQEQVTKASLLFVLCANLKSWEESPERYWQNASDEIKKTLIPMIKSFYEGKEALQRDEAMRSVGIAAQTLMLSARAMGYDSCPMIGFDADKVAELVQLPANHVVGMMITVGKAVKPAHPRGGQLSLAEVLIRNRF